MGQRDSGSAASYFDDSEHDAAIYRSYAPELVRYANSLVGPSDAADVVSSAVLKAFTSKSWAAVENHRAYLYRAVLNEVRSQYRSTMRRQAREQRAAVPESVSLPEIRPEILAALGALSARQRAVAYLTDSLLQDVVCPVPGRHIEDGFRGSESVSIGTFYCQLFELAGCGF